MAMTGAEARELRNKRNAARAAGARGASSPAPRRAQDIEDVNLSPPEGMPKPPESSGLAPESDEIGQPPEGMPMPKGAAAFYLESRRQMRSAADLPGGAPIATPAQPAPGSPTVPAVAPATPAVPGAPAVVADDAGGDGDADEDDKKKNPPAEAQPMPMTPMAPAGEPPAALVPPAGGGFTPVPIPNADEDSGTPPPMEMERKKDEAWAEMMGDEEMEPQEGQPYAVALTLHNAAAKPAGPAGPFYLATINGHAVGEIHLADQAHGAELHPVFVDQSRYTPAFLRAVSQMGFKKAMGRVHGRLYRAKLEKGALAKKIEAEIAAKYEAEYKRRAARLRDEYVNKLNVSAMALNKNILHDGRVHPLKEALVKRLASELKIHPVRAMVSIEAAFEEGFLPTFNQIAAKAEELIKAPPEFFAAYEKEVRASAPKTASAALPSTAEPYSRMDALMAGSLPLVAGQSQRVEGEDLAEIQATLRASLGGI
jgi:hypothetical protein